MKSVDTALGIADKTRDYREDMQDMTTNVQGNGYKTTIQAKQNLNQLEYIRQEMHSRSVFFLLLLDRLRIWYKSTVYQIIDGDFISLWVIRVATKEKKRYPNLITQSGMKENTNSILKHFRTQKMKIDKKRNKV